MLVICKKIYCFKYFLVLFLFIAMCAPSPPSSPQNAGKLHYKLILWFLRTQMCPSVLLTFRTHQYDVKTYAITHPSLALSLSLCPIPWNFSWTMALCWKREKKSSTNFVVSLNMHIARRATFITSTKCFYVILNQMEPNERAYAL